MANIFCPNCGFKTSYQFAVPNFCSKCGKPYIKSKANHFSSKRPIVNSMQDPDDDEEDEGWDEDDLRIMGEDFSDSLFVPNIKKINVELDYSNSEVKSFKFGEIFGENVSEGNRFPIKKPKNLSDLL